MFTEDSRAENFLTGRGIKWKYCNGVQLPAEFAPGWDANNIGRPVSIREDAVVEYAAQMANGSIAPAPILYMTDAGYMVCDGVQRLTAGVSRHITTISAYVVETDDENSIMMIRVLANPILQGRAELLEWSKRRAVEVLVVERGMSLADVAGYSGWKSADIKRLADAIKLQERITNIGGPALSDAMLEELRPHMRDKAALEAVGVPVAGFLQVLKRSRISVVDAVPFINQFYAPIPQTKNLHKTYKERLDRINEDPEIKSRLTGRQGTALPDSVVLHRMLKAAETKLEEIMTGGEGLVNLDEYFRIVDNMFDNLKTLQNGKRAAKGGNNGRKK